MITKNKDIEIRKKSEMEFNIFSRKTGRYIGEIFYVNGRGKSVFQPNNYTAWDQEALKMVINLMED